jgi:hypothetical protein
LKPDSDTGASGIGVNRLGGNQPFFRGAMIALERADGTRRGPFLERRQDVRLHHRVGHGFDVGAQLPPVRLDGMRGVSGAFGDGVGGEVRIRLQVPHEHGPLGEV